MEVGKRIRQLRLKNGLTLEELANRAEITKGFLSQIERDLTSPSITTLNYLVEALGLTMEKFFKDDKLEQIVFKKEDFSELKKEELTINWIVPNAQKNKMEPLLVQLLPGGKTSIIDPHEGEEFGYVFKGSVTLFDGDYKRKIKKGESFYLKGINEHYFLNEGKQEVKFIWVSTPPIF